MRPAPTPTREPNSYADLLWQVALGRIEIPAGTNWRAFKTAWLLERVWRGQGANPPVLEAVEAAVS